MTPERQDEIWAMLDADAQEWIKEQYEEILEDIADYKVQNTDSGSPIMENRAIGQKQMLVRLFGKHNLTAQAEGQPEEPSFKVGDKVKILEDGTFCGSLGSIIRTHSINNMYLVRACVEMRKWCSPEGLAPYTEPKEETDENSVSPYLKRSNPTENGISDSKIQSESAESVETRAKKDAYFAYRLDLAKEIAVAMLKDDWATMSVTAIAIDAVDMANEIVKRLKETEI